VSQTTFCDVCGDTIRNNTEKLLVAMFATTEPNAMDDYFSMIQHHKNGDLQVKELCHGCRKVLYYLLNSRITHVRRLRDKVNRIWDSKEATINEK